MSQITPPPWANNYTELRDRPSRWWGITFISKVFGHGILVSAIIPAFVGSVICAAPLLLLSALGVDLGPWILLVGLAAFCVVYGCWNSLRPEGMKISDWLFVFYDYTFRQPRRFNGLRVDTEPSTIAWSVIVYTPHPKAPKRTRGAST